MRLKNPMADMSLPLASLLYDVGNGILIVGAIAVVLGTWLAVYTGGIKERYGESRIASNEAQAAVANKVAAQANERAAALELEAAQFRTKAADLEHQTVELNLQLEKVRSVRSVDRDLIETLRGVINQYPNTKFDVGINPGDVECSNFALSLASTLRSLGWHQVNWEWSANVVNSDSPFILGNVGVSDVSIVIDTDHNVNIEPVASALSAALKKSGYDASIDNLADWASNAPKPVPPPDILHVLVGQYTKR